MEWCVVSLCQFHLLPFQIADVSIRPRAGRAEVQRELEIFSRKSERCAPVVEAYVSVAQFDPAGLQTEKRLAPGEAGRLFLRRGHVAAAILLDSHGHLWPHNDQLFQRDLPSKKGNDPDSYLDIVCTKERRRVLILKAVQRQTIHIEPQFP